MRVAVYVTGEGLVRLPEFVNVYVTESWSSGVNVNVLESVPLPVKVVILGLKI